MIGHSEEFERVLAELPEELRREIETDAAGAKAAEVDERLLNLLQSMPLFASLRHMSPAINVTCGIAIGISLAFTAPEWARAFYLQSATGPFAENVAEAIAACLPISQEEERE